MTSRGSDAKSLISIERAQHIVLESCRPTPVAAVDLSDSLGSVCAREVHSVEDVPPFDNSAVDGYAVRASDTTRGVPVTLRVVGEVAAGASTEVEVGKGEAIRIMTGAPIPPGADCVVMVEVTRRLDSGSGDVEQVEILQEVSSGAAVRRAGDDVRRGDLVFERGTVITPMVAGVLATVNCRRPLIHERPRVAILSTGDELVDDGSELGAGQIRESNRTMLLGMIDAAGARAVDYGIVRDDEQVLEAVLGRAGDECDAIVTSGGVSMGDYDVVKAVLGRIADMTWMQIAIKPAKPFAFGLLQRGGRQIPVFGLPGNPVSSMVSFELLARPALRKMAGFPHDMWHRPLVRAIADQPLQRSSDGKVHYHRVVARWNPQGRVVVAPVRAQGSHQLAASALANALAVLPDGNGIATGHEVDVILLSD